VAAEEEAAELSGAVDPDRLDAAIARRELGEPLAWITGRFRFCDRWYTIAPGVYVPRPQTEELARRAAARLPPGGRALDLCCGAGAIAAHLAAEVPSATVIGVDVDPAAAACARRNGLTAVVGDSAGAIRTGAAFDVVTAVAPYVPTGAIRLLPPDVQRHEPPRALDGGSDGTTVVRRVVRDAARVLRPGGALFVEVGGDQDATLAPVLARAGFGDVAPWHDEDGDLRGVVATRP